jgi:hypothetical protein
MGFADVPFPVSGGRRMIFARCRAVSSVFSDRGIEKKHEEGLTGQGKMGKITVFVSCGLVTVRFGSRLVSLTGPRLSAFVGGISWSEK